MRSLSRGERVKRVRTDDVRPEPCNYPRAGGFYPALMPGYSSTTQSNNNFITVTTDANGSCLITATAQTHPRRRLSPGAPRVYGGDPRDDARQRAPEGASGSPRRHEHSLFDTLSQPRPVGEGVFWSVAGGRHAGRILFTSQPHPL